ncbi:hypothetical protein AB0H43_04245 [Hamadaea sp. NPDC050747]|uniref:hypothetical protein n=1 Tax=Hamadaea sp. NPDC050747 TaxID=3155789 RepID=UPI0034104021
MFAKLRQRREQLRGVEFCESCAQVCTAECRVQARVERVQVQALYVTGLLR